MADDETRARAVVIVMQVFGTAHREEEWAHESAEAVVADLAAAGLLAAPAAQPVSYHVEPQQLTPGGPIHGGFTVVETPAPPTRPDVVTLCGSMRFHAQMLAVADAETAAGHIVLAPFCVVAQDDQDGTHKAMLDRLHRDKVRMADRVIVVSDESGYYGESTAREIRYAGELGLPVESRNVASPAAPADDEAAIAPTEILEDGASWLMPEHATDFHRIVAWIEGGNAGVGLMTWLTTINVTCAEGRAIAVRLVAAADYADAALAALREGKQQ